MRNHLFAAMRNHLPSSLRPQLPLPKASRADGRSQSSGLRVSACSRVTDNTFDLNDSEILVPPARPAPVSAAAGAGPDQAAVGAGPGV